MEEWRIAPNTLNKYEVSNLGNVRNVKRKKNLKLAKGTDGYLYLTFFNGNKYGRKCAHRLIAQAFIPNPECKEQVNHKNFIRDDNRIENLEWVTEKENHHHAKINGRFIHPRPWLIGSRHHQAILNEEQVIEIRKLIDSKKYTQTEIGKMYGVAHNTISYIKLKGWKNVKEYCCNI